MNAVALTLLAGALAAPPGPFPDGKTIDSFTLHFGAFGNVGGGGTLNVSGDGKVTYEHETAPPWAPPVISPFSGNPLPVFRRGTITEKEWKITKEQAAELFRKLVADGLLDLPAQLPKFKPVDFYPQYTFEAKSGKWSQFCSAETVPDKLMAHLRPLLTKAHPELWAEKPDDRAPSKPGELSSVTYTRWPNADFRDYATLCVRRDGKVTYTRDAAVGDAPKTSVGLSWVISAKDAAALLDALVADGLLDLKDTEQGERDTILAFSGRWEVRFRTRGLPDALSERLLPLLKKADTKFWK